MKIKLDENLPDSLVPILTSLGHEVDTVKDEGISGREDSVVWDYAQADGRFLITQDLDFSDIRKFAPGTHHGILLIRLIMPGKIALEDRIRSLFESENTSDWQRSLIVVTERKIRITRA